MKKILTILMLAVFAGSCIKKEYDLRDGVDMNIKIGSDVLYVPIGSTDSIFLRDFLDVDSVEMLEILDDESYALVIDTSISMDDLIDLDVDMLEIPDIVEHAGENVDLSGDFDNFQLDGVSIIDSIAMGLATGSFPEINLPDVSVKDTFETTLFDSILSELASVGLPWDVPPTDIPINDALFPPMGISDSASFSFSVSLPSQIKTVDTIRLQPGAKLSLNISADRLPPGMEMHTHTLQLEFPEQIRLRQGELNVSGQSYIRSSGEYPLTGDPDPIEIPIEYLIFDASDHNAGSLNMQEYIKFTAEYGFAGVVSSENPLPDVEDDPRMIFDVETHLNFEDAVVTLNPIQQDLPATNIPIEMETPIDDVIDSVGKIELEDAFLTLALNIPDISEDVQIAAGTAGINIGFPQLFELDNLQQYPDVGSVTFTEATNKLKITGAIPDSIRLKIISLRVNQRLSDGMFEIDDSVTIEGAVATTEGQASSTDFEALASKKVYLNATVSKLKVASVEIGSIAQVFKDTLPFEVDEEIPQEILSLDSILLQGTKIKLKLHSSKTQLGGKDVNIHIKAQLPQCILMSSGVQPGNVIDETIAFDAEGDWEKELDVRGLKLDANAIQNGRLKINEDLNYELRISVEDPTIDLETDFDGLLTYGMDVSITDVRFGKVYGRISPSIDAIRECVSIAAELPEMLQDTAMRLDVDPRLAIDLATNLQIPFGAKIVLTPYKGGSPIPGARKEVEIIIPKAPTSAVLSTKYWIARTDEGMPGDFIFKEVALGDLVKQIPDSLAIEVQPAIDGTQQSIFDVNADYSVAFGVNFMVPLAFGPELNVVITQTIDSLDDVIGEMLSGKKIGLNGQILNSIPLKLSASITPIDENGKVIDIEPARLDSIRAGNSDGSAAESSLDIVFDDPDGKLKDMRGLEVKFVGKQTNSSYVSIKPSNFIKIKLNARIEGGVEFDLDDLGNDDKDKDKE